MESMSAARSILVYLTGLVSLLVLLVFVVVSKVRLLITRIYCALRGEHFEVMAGFDTAFLMNSSTYFGDPTCGSLSLAVLFLQGDVQLSVIQQKTLERIILARNPTTGAKEMPRLTQRCVRRYGFWTWQEVDHFDIDHHFLLNPTGYLDDASLVRFIQDNLNRPLPQDRPPWDVFLIPKRDQNGAQTGVWALILRWNHAIGDGMQAMKLCFLGADEHSQKTLKEILKAFHLNKSSWPPLFRNNTLLRYIADPDEKLSPSKLLDILGIATWMVLSVPWVIGVNFLHREKNGLHGPVVCGRKLLALAEPLDLKTFQEVASTFQCTVSDVFYSCLVSSYRQCDPTPAPHIRVSSTSIIKKPGDSGSENCFTCFTPVYPTTHDDPVTQLKCVSQIAQNAKKSPEPIINVFIVSLLASHLPPSLVKVIFHGYRCSALASNLHGPSFNLSFSGYTTVDTFFIAPTLGRLGVSFSCNTYNGLVRLCVTVDRAVAPDDKIADQLATSFVQEVKKLHSIAIGSQ